MHVMMHVVCPLCKQNEREREVNIYSVLIFTQEQTQHINMMQTNAQMGGGLQTHYYAIML